MPSIHLKRRSRLTTALLVILGLILLGTVAVLSTAKAYFSIDKSAYIIASELGTWDEIASGTEIPAGWLDRYPWVWKLLHSNSAPGDAGIGPLHKGAPAKDGAPITDASQLAELVAAGAFDQPFPVTDAVPPNPKAPPEKIPRIIHQTWKDEHLPAKWQTIRDECAAMHPDYEYMLWTDASSRSFIQEHYPWFLPVFDAYPYGIQRADAIRYFVLHYYGGVYMDLDIGCRRRLDPLLRFEIILPVTRPVGVSNDLIFAQKGHPFMDHLIHNLVTFNHHYLSHYPTVMFSTGPMFVSASYVLYVDAHGAAIPSSPSAPKAGFTGLRVLPKSLYGKNADPSEVPDSFFKHFYGSSWHAGDAGLLIWLRDHGRFVMFLGACLLAYGVCRLVLPRLLFALRKSSPRSGPLSPSRRRDSDWIGVPIQTSTRRSNRVGRRPPILRTMSQTPDVTLDMLSGDHAGPSSPSHDASGRLSPATSRPALSVAAPRPQRLTVPFFELAEEDEDTETDSASPPSPGSMEGEPRGVLSWAGLSRSRAGSDAGTDSDNENSPWKKASGVLWLPAYALSRIGSPGRRDRDTPEYRERLITPSEGSSRGRGNSSNHSGRRPSTLAWASSLLPPQWRGAAASYTRALLGDEDIEMDGHLRDAEEASTPSTDGAGRTSYDKASAVFGVGDRGEDCTTPLATSSNLRGKAWLNNDDIESHQEGCSTPRGRHTSHIPSARFLVPSAGGAAPSTSHGHSLAQQQKAMLASYRTPPPPYEPSNMSSLRDGGGNSSGPGSGNTSARQSVEMGRRDSFHSMNGGDEEAESAAGSGPGAEAQGGK